jgi:hypothetical protein
MNIQLVDFHGMLYKALWGKCKVYQVEDATCIHARDGILFRDDLLLKVTERLSIASFVVASTGEEIPCIHITWYCGYTCVHYGCDTFPSFVVFNPERVEVHSGTVDMALFDLQTWVHQQSFH